MARRPTGRGQLLCSALLLSCLAAAAPDEPSAVVAADGSGDHRTVQAAVDAVPDAPAARHVILIRPGTYHEQVRVPRGKPPITFRGEDAERTILTFDLSTAHLDEHGRPLSTTATASTLIEADDFTAEQVSFANSHGPGRQAVAIKVVSDRVIFRRCRFLGWQDTLYIAAHGRHYFEDCYIEGHVDFIFGRSTAVFVNCEIRSKGPGYVTAASTEAEAPFGYVFIRCRLTADEDVADESVYLGRPWRPHASVTFIHCRLGPHIRPEGWHNWGNPDNEATARYAEYRSSGGGANPAARAGWSRQLSDEEAEAISIRSVLSGEDGWQPQ